MSTTVLDKILDRQQIADENHMPLPDVAIRTKHYNLPVKFVAKHTSLIVRDDVPLHFCVGLRCAGPCNTDYLLSQGYINEDVPSCGVNHAGHTITAYSGEPFAVGADLTFDPARWDVTRARFISVALAVGTAEQVAAIIDASNAEGIAELDTQAYQDFLDVTMPVVNGKPFTLPRLDVLDTRNYATLYRDRDAFEQFLPR